MIQRRICIDIIIPMDVKLLRLIFNLTRQLENGTICTRLQRGSLHKMRRTNKLFATETHTHKRPVHSATYNIGNDDDRKVIISKSMF